MAEIKIFENPEFGEIRTTVIDGEPWFVGRDVAEVLGYANSRKALSDHVDADEKGVTKCDTLGGMQDIVIINESGLYSLIISSKLPKAREFKKWVTSEVLPSIRKHGAYMVDAVIEQALSSPDLLIQLATQLKESKERCKVAEENNQKLQIAYEGQKRELLEMKPKASYFDIVMQCSDLVPISVIAKDYGMSAVALNKKLRDKKIQYKQSGVWLLYQQYAALGYTSTKTSLHYDSDGVAHSDVHTQWTQKGRLFIYNELAKDGISPLIEQQ